jgi:MYXO-CTERM domain-containing protein
MERVRRGGLFVLWLIALASSVAHADGTVPYHTVFLNRCANGCTVTGPAPANSVDDTWYTDGPRVLAAFPFDDASWERIVDCVEDVFAAYQIRVVEVDPGTASHFEVKFAGRPTDIGENQNFIGVAPPGCSTTYMDNGLVFVFAVRIKETYGLGTSCEGSCVEKMCWTAVQELGHVWQGMDHVIVADDPMTYLPTSTRKYFQDVDAQCGSDCRNGFSPDGLMCTGTSNDEHRCNCTMSQTQNSHRVVSDLFGLTPTTPCEDDVDCPDSTDACIGGRCVAGIGAAGGLGNACTAATDCISKQCVNDGAAAYCVEQCQPGECPTDFGCRPVEGGEGVCWPSYIEETGCGCRSTSPGHAGTFVLAIILLRLRRRSRRRGGAASSADRSATDRASEQRRSGCPSRAPSPR